MQAFLSWDVDETKLTTPLDSLLLLMFSKVLPSSSFAPLCDILYSSQIIGWHWHNASGEFEYFLKLQMGLSFVIRFSGNVKTELALHPDNSTATAVPLCYQPWREVILQMSHHQHEERKVFFSANCWMQHACRHIVSNLRWNGHLCVRERGGERERVKGCVVIYTYIDKKAYIFMYVYMRHKKYCHVGSLLSLFLFYTHQEKVIIAYIYVCIHENTHPHSHTQIHKCIQVYIKKHTCACITDKKFNCKHGEQKVNKKF